MNLQNFQFVATKPDIAKIRKAFWSRKNRFNFSKTFAKLNNRRKARRHPENPRAGAVVSLAAMVAGMSSMPIVQTDQHGRFLLSLNTTTKSISYISHCNYLIY